MADYDPSNPERFVPLKFPTSGQARYVDKIFDDPDFIRLYLGSKKDFEISWATNANAAQSLDLISDMAKQFDFNKGTIVLRHTFSRPGVIVGGANQLEGLAEDIMNEVQDSGDRTIGYTLHSKELDLYYRPTWPRTYHDIPTNEFVLKLGRRNSMARFVIDQTISLTAMDGLKNATDTTLDEFSEFLPILRS